MMLTELEAKQLEKEDLVLSSIDYKKNDFRYVFTDTKGEKHNIHLSFAKQEDAIVINTYSIMDNEEVRVCISSLVHKSKQVVVEKPKYRLLYIAGLLKIYAPDEIITNLDAYKKHQDLVYVYHHYKEQLLALYENSKAIGGRKPKREKEAIELVFYGKDGLNLARVLTRLKIATYEEKVKYLKYNVTFKDDNFGLQMESVEHFKKGLEKMGFMIFWY